MNETIIVEMADGSKLTLGAYGLMKLLGERLIDGIEGVSSLAHGYELRRASPDGGSADHHLAKLRAHAAAWKLCAKTYFALVEKERKALRWTIKMWGQATRERDATRDALRRLVDAVEGTVSWSERPEISEATDAARALLGEEKE